MFAQTRLAWIAICVGVVAMVSPCGGQPPITNSPVAPSGSQPTSRTTVESVARYATDAFVAAGRIRPRALIEHPYFGSLPFHALLPEPLSLGRLDSMGVEELVVFCGPAQKQTGDAPQADGIQWAAAARTAQPLRLESLRKQWRQTLMPQQPAPVATPVAIRIENHDCFQLPAGSFLPPPRTYGELRFTDRSGHAVKRGINIGDVYPRRSYVEGATGSSAIFSLTHVGESTLVDGHLPLELRLNVFLASKLDHEYSVAQIELRNPDNGLRSKPILFEAKSYVNHRLNVPRQLTVVAEGGAKDGDLVKDLVSGGRLEVILKATEARVYVGVGKQDLNVRREAFEYVFMSDHEIVVAQTLATLQQMLSTADAPVSLAQRLVKPAADIAIVVHADEHAQRIVLKNLARAIGVHSASAWLTDALTDLTATISVERAPIFQIIAKFDDSADANLAAIQVKRTIGMAQSYAHENLLHSLHRNDAMGALTAIAFDGVEMRFPVDTSTGTEQRAEQLLAIIDETLDNVEAETIDNVLTVDGSRNPSHSAWPPAAIVALANVEEIFARDLRERKRFDLGDEMNQRVTDRFPHVPQTWFRRAHQLSYNTSVKFDGDQNRYAWVRRGIEVLLDGAEQNPESTDLTWMAGRFISRKIGYVDNRLVYRRLFSQDEDLHHRLAKIIDMEKARSAENQIDNYLVAKALFEHCIARHTRSQAVSTIPPVLFLSRPAASQARYAQSLSESGNWMEALAAWKEAERLHVDLEAGGFSQADKKRIRLDDWLRWCQIEQSAGVQSMRKLAHAAAAQAAQGNAIEAYVLYRQFLRKLDDLYQENPDEISLIAGELRQEASSYRKIAAQLQETPDETMEAVLVAIEQTQPLSEALLIPVNHAFRH